MNPSGGLESKGHPLGATGLGNVFYLVTQLRGWSGPMQVADAAPGARNDKEAYAMLHNLGLGTSPITSALAEANAVSRRRVLRGWTFQAAIFLRIW